MERAVSLPPRGDSADVLCRIGVPGFGQPRAISAASIPGAPGAAHRPGLAVVVVLSALILGPVFTTLPLRRYFTSPEFGGFFLNIVAVAHVTPPGVFEHNPDPRFIASQLWTIPFEFQCYVALAILALLNLLRDRRALAQIIVLAALAATLHALLLSPVSPFDHVPGRVLILCFLAAVSLYFYRDAIPCSPRLAMGAAVASAVLLEIPTPPISRPSPSPI
jgi:peptidoglycan/LPS O-acetylase OafA/YrhL